MALSKCKECGAQVSTKAKSCPQCGAEPPKRTSLLTWIVGGAFAWAVGSCVFKSADSGAPPPSAAYPSGATVASVKAANEAAPKKPPPSPEDEKRDRARYVAANAVKVLKSAMHDPKSFELEEAVFMPDGAGCYTYRAKNGFGAQRRSEAVLLPGASGLVTSDDRKAFVSAFNKHCTKAGGERITAYVNMYVL